MAQLDLELAEELLRKGRYSEAIERLRMLLSDNPDDPEIRGRAAEAYRLSGNQERAFHHFNKAAAIYTRKNEVLGACRMLKAANSVSPNEPDILFRMAECMKMLGNRPEFEQVLRQLITVARASGDRRRAWALDELCSMYPDDLDLAINHATVLGESGRVAEAIDGWKRVSARLDQRGQDMAPLLKRAAELGGDQPEVGVDLAEILMVHGRPRDALALLVPFYERFPDEVRVLEALLRALEQLGASDKIVPARIELVKARTKLGQRALAVTEITKLLKEAPTDPRALEVCAHACAAFGITGEATRLWFQLARIYDAQGQTAGRDRALFACLKANPSHEAALELGARVLADAGQTDEAASLERRLSEVRRNRSEMSEDLPAAPMGDTAEVAAELPDGLEETPDPSSEPDWRNKSTTMMLDDADVLDEVLTGEERTIAPPGSSSWSAVDITGPDQEQMPIHKNPWAGDLEGGADEQATRVAPQQLSARDLESPTSEMSGRRRFTTRDIGSMALPPEHSELAEEVTSRTTAGAEEEEIRALRAEFGSDDQPTWIELETQSALTPAGGTPLKAEEFDERRRLRAQKRMMSGLQDEIAKDKS